jgi:AcrR family transcriptional regulator
MYGDGVPKQVDHAERRERIADAVLAVVARGGIEEASVRHVAAEAGVSVGMVQHYFRSKDELMRAALARVGERVQARLGSEIAAPEEAARALFHELLPDDGERAREARVALAFLAYAAVRPEVGEELREDAVRLRGFFADGFGSEVAAAGLLALMDGLGMQVLLGQIDANLAIRVFDAQLDRVLDN